MGVSVVFHVAGELGILGAVFTEGLRKVRANSTTNCARVCGCLRVRIDDAFPLYKAYLLISFPSIYRILGDYETLVRYRICDILSDFTGGASEVRNDFYGRYF